MWNIPIYAEVDKRDLCNLHFNLHDMRQATWKVFRAKGVASKNLEHSRCGKRTAELPFVKQAFQFHVHREFACFM